MYNIIADAKPTADIEYLSSAIVKEALTRKFKELFGRDPVYRSPEEPMRVEDARVPTLISDSVDPQIATMLTASAIEATAAAAGPIPEISNATLLYTIKDTDPASVALEAIEEYRALDAASADATAQAVSELDTINIEEGTAYLSPEMSAIDIGIFVQNTPFAEEFQYRLENAGGATLSPEKKETVFNDLFGDLPGGGDMQASDVRQALLSVVGLTEAMTPEQQVAPGNEAPGPDAVAENA